MASEVYTAVSSCSACAENRVEPEPKKGATTILYKRLLELIPINILRPLPVLQMILNTELYGLADIKSSRKRCQQAQQLFSHRKCALQVLDSFVQHTCLCPNDQQSAAHEQVVPNVVLHACHRTGDGISIQPPN